MIKAGFARVDVTPPLGNPLAGYFHARYADGILDPLQLNALAFGNGQDTAVIIACDFIGITKEVCEEVRVRIEDATGVLRDRIMISGLHQHTSVSIGNRRGVKSATSFSDETYLHVLYRKFVDVAKMAIDDMGDAVASTAEGEVLPNVAFVRRYWLDDGTVATNPAGDEAKPVRHCDDSDNTVRLLRFKRSGENCDKKDIAYVNFPTHADVISGNKYSADWPGFVRRFVEADLGAYCLSTIGCEGDSNHINYLVPSEERYPEGSGYRHSEFMGRTIADTVAKIWDKTEEVVGDVIFGSVDTVYNKANAEGEELYDEMKAFIDDFNAGRLKSYPHITDLARAKRIIGIKTIPIYIQVPITVIGLGNFAFVGFGGEPFTHYHIAAKAAAPDKTVFTVACANGYEGYLPHARAFVEGGYEAANSPFTPPLEEQCIEAAKKLLQDFKSF